MIEKINILLIEKNTDDADYIAEVLSEPDLKKSDISRVACLEDAIILLKSIKYDIIILDIGLPDSQIVLNLLSIIKEHNATALIIITGKEDYIECDNNSGIDAQNKLIKSLPRSDKLSRVISYSAERKREKKRLLDIKTQLRISEEKLHKINTELASINKELHASEFENEQKDSNLKHQLSEINRFSAVIKQSPAIVVITDVEGVIVYVNNTFCKKTGYTKDGSIGQKANIMKAEKETQQKHIDIWNAITNRKIWKGELLNKKKNGELYWESATIFPIYDDKHEAINYIKVAEDISQLKRNEEVQKVILNISNAVLTTINLNKFIEFIHLELSKIIDTTNFYVTLYDKESEECTLVFHKDQKNKSDYFIVGKSLTNYIIKSRKPLLVTQKVKEKLIKEDKIDPIGSTSKIWLGVPLISKNEVIGAFAVLSYDDEKAYNEDDLNTLQLISHQISISIERIEANIKLERALEKATESDRLKTAFLSNMSHEIRTPMNGIIGFIELLNDPSFSDEEKKEFTTVITRSSFRLLNTINDMIDISKIEAGQMNIIKNNIIINDMLQELYDFFIPQASEKDLDFSFISTLSDEESKLVSDNQRLHGILANLIKNAIKYTEKGSVKYGCDIRGENFEFYVHDTGIGIPKDRITAIFNRFEQADIEDTRAFEGSGLGLTIAKSYTEMLGGNIIVSSTEGKGSVFTVKLPFR